jgi:hypothetical protein
MIPLNAAQMKDHKGTPRMLNMLREADMKRLIMQQLAQRR